MSESRSRTPGGDARGSAFELLETAQGLALRALHRPAWHPLTLDWIGSEQQRRIAGGRRQLLARAVGLHRTRTLQICDATGGLGRDAFTLSALGAEVTLIERAPLLVALLRDAQRRALLDARWHEAAARIRIVEGQASALMTGGTWDVVHLDPMYPHRGKQALPQKELQLLRDLVGEDADADALLAPAMRACRLRAVVKRPSAAPPLAALPPAHVLRGTQARYDVYLPARPASTG